METLPEYALELEREEKMVAYSTTRPEGPGKAKYQGLGIAAG
jgi:hypothetical protein